MDNPGPPRWLSVRLQFRSFLKSLIIFNILAVACWHFVFYALAKKDDSIFVDLCYHSIAFIQAGYLGGPKRFNNISMPHSCKYTDIRSDHFIVDPHDVLWYSYLAICVPFVTKLMSNNLNWYFQVFTLSFGMVCIDYIWNIVAITDDDLKKCVAYFEAYVQQQSKMADLENNVYLVAMVSKKPSKTTVLIREALHFFLKFLCMRVIGAIIWEALRWFAINPNSSIKAIMSDHCFFTFQFRMKVYPEEMPSDFASKFALHEAARAQFFRYDFIWSLVIASVSLMVLHGSLEVLRFVFKKSESLKIAAFSVYYLSASLVLQFGIQLFIIVFTRDLSYCYMEFKDLL